MSKRFKTSWNKKSVLQWEQFDSLCSSYNIRQRSCQTVVINNPGVITITWHSRVWHIVSHTCCANIVPSWAWSSHVSMAHYLQRWNYLWFSFDVIYVVAIGETMGTILKWWQSIHLGNSTISRGRLYGSGCEMRVLKYEHYCNMFLY